MEEKLSGQARVSELPLSRADSRITYEVLNFIDGKRSVLDIRNAVSVEYSAACRSSWIIPVASSPSWNPARVLGVDSRVGTIAEGLEADLIVVDRNPLEDFRALYTTNEPILVILTRNSGSRRESAEFHELMAESWTLTARGEPFPLVAATPRYEPLVVISNGKVAEEVLPFRRQLEGMGTAIVVVQDLEPPFGPHPLHVTREGRNIQLQNTADLCGTGTPEFVHHH